MHSERLGYTAFFPDKPKQAERKLPYSGHELTQVLDIAQVKNASVSITTIEVPASINEQAFTLMGQLQESMLKSASASDPAPIQIKSSYQIAGINRTKAPVDDYLLVFKNNDGHRWMRVRWIVRLNPAGGSRIYQQSLLMPAPSKEASFEKELTAERWEPFFDEFRVD